VLGSDSLKRSKWVWMRTVVAAVLSVGWLVPAALGVDRVLSFLNEDMARLSLMRSARPTYALPTEFNDAPNLLQAREFLIAAGAWLALVVAGWAIYIVRSRRALQNSLSVPAGDLLGAHRDALDQQFKVFAQEIERHRRELDSELGPLGQQVSGAPSLLKVRFDAVQDQLSVVDTSMAHQTETLRAVATRLEGAMAAASSQAQQFNEQLHESMHALTDDLMQQIQAERSANDVQQRGDQDQRFVSIHNAVQVLAAQVETRLDVALARQDVAVQEQSERLGSALAQQIDCSIEGLTLSLADAQAQQRLDGDALAQHIGERVVGLLAEQATQWLPSGPAESSESSELAPSRRDEQTLQALQTAVQALHDQLAQTLQLQRDAGSEARRQAQAAVQARQAVQEAQAQAVADLAVRVDQLRELAQSLHIERITSDGTKWQVSLAQIQSALAQAEAAAIAREVQRESEREFNRQSQRDAHRALAAAVADEAAVRSADLLAAVQSLHVQGEGLRVAVADAASLAASQAAHHAAATAEAAQAAVRQAANEAAQAAAEAAVQSVAQAVAEPLAQSVELRVSPLLDRAGERMWSRWTEQAAEHQQALAALQTQAHALGDALAGWGQRLQKDGDEQDRQRRLDAQAHAEALQARLGALDAQLGAQLEAQQIQMQAARDGAADAAPQARAAAEGVAQLQAQVQALAAQVEQQHGAAQEGLERRQAQWQGDWQTLAAQVHQALAAAQALAEQTARQAAERAAASEAASEARRLADLQAQTHAAQQVVQEAVQQVAQQASEQAARQAAAAMDAAEVALQIGRQQAQEAAEQALAAQQAEVAGRIEALQAALAQLGERVDRQREAWAREQADRQTQQTEQVQALVAQLEHRLHAAQDAQDAHAQTQGLRLAALHEASQRLQTQQQVLVESSQQVQARTEALAEQMHQAQQARPSERDEAMLLALERRLSALDALEAQVGRLEDQLGHAGVDRLATRLTQIEVLLSAHGPARLELRLSQLEELLSTNARQLEGRLGDLQGLVTQQGAYLETMPATLQTPAERQLDERRLQQLCLNLSDLQENLRLERRQLRKKAESLNLNLN